MALVAVQWFLPAAATLVGLQLQLASSTPPAPHHHHHHHIIGPGPSGNQAKFHHQPSSSSRDPFLIQRVLKSIDQYEQHNRKIQKPATKSEKNITRYKRRQVSSSSFRAAAAAHISVSRVKDAVSSSPLPKHDLTQSILSSKLIKRELSELDYELDGGNQQPTAATNNNNNINNLPGTRRYNRPRNKKPVYVSINQQTVNGLLSLLLLFVVSICGTLGTIFIISSLTVIESLQTRGNCYLVSLALSHLLVTLLVIPTSAIQIMAGDGIDGRLLCHYQWLTLEFSLIVGQLSFLLMAADNYLGYKSTEKVTTIGTTTNVSMAANQQHPSLLKHTNITSPATAVNSTQNTPPNEIQLTINSQINEPPMMIYNNKQCLLPIISGGDSRKWHFFNLRSMRNSIAGCLCLLPKMSEQKLRLINQFVDQKATAESTVERPGCFSYRNWCGRLKVLFWISSVWLVASICTFHKHELRYGPNFCPAPIQSATATKQPTSNTSQPQAVPVTSNSHAQSMLLLMNHRDELGVMNSSLEKISPTTRRFGRSIDHSGFNQASYSIPGSHSTDRVPNVQTYHHSSSMINEKESSNRSNNVENSLGRPTTTTTLPSAPISTKERYRIKPKVESRSDATTYDELGGPNDGDAYGQHQESSASAQTGMNEIEVRCKGACFDKSLIRSRRTYGGGSGGFEDGSMNDLVVARFNFRGLKRPKIGPVSAGGQLGNFLVGYFWRPLVNKVVDLGTSFKLPPSDNLLWSEGAGRGDYGAHDDDDDDDDGNTDSSEMGAGVQPTETFELIGTDSKTRYDSYHRNRAEERLIGGPLKLFQGHSSAGEEEKEREEDKSCLPCKGSDCKCSGRNDGSADNSNVGDSSSSSSRLGYNWPQKVSQLVGGGSIGGIYKGQMVVGAASVESGHRGDETIPLKQPSRGPDRWWWWIRHWLPSGPSADAAQGKRNNFTKATNQQQQLQPLEHLTIVERGNGNHDVGGKNNHHPILGNSSQVKQDGLSSLLSSSQAQAPSLFLFLVLLSPLNKRQQMIEGWTQQFRQRQQQNRQNLPPLGGDENFRSQSIWRNDSSPSIALQVAALERNPATVELKDLMNNDNHNHNYNPVVGVGGGQTVMVRSKSEAAGRGTQDGSWLLVELTAPTPARARRRVRAVPTSGNNGKNSIKMLVSANDDDELPSASTTRSIKMEQASQYGANQLMVMLMDNNNQMAPNEQEDSNLSSQLNRTSNPSTTRGGAGDTQQNHFWLILFCTIIFPTLISAILFLKAWLKMKIFKMRPYKPMPVAALNSAMSSILVTSQTVPQQHQQMYPPETRQAPSSSLVGQQPSCSSQPPIARNLNHRETDKIGTQNEANLGGGDDDDDDHHRSPRFKRPTNNANQFGAPGNACSTLDSIHNRRSVSQPSGGAAGGPTDNQAIAPLGLAGMAPDKATAPEPPLELIGTRGDPSLAKAATSNQGVLMSKIIAPPPLPPSPATVTLPAMSPSLPAQRQQVNQVMSAPIGYSHYVQQQQQQQLQQQHHYHHHPLQHQYNQPEPSGAARLATNPYGNPCGLPAARAAYQQQQDHQLSGPACYVMNRLGAPPFQFDETVQAMRETYSSPSSASFNRREFNGHDELFSISEPLQQQTILRPSPAPSQQEPAKPMANSSGSHLRSSPPQQQQQQHGIAHPSHYHHQQHHHHSSHQSPASRRLSPIQQQHYEFRRRQNHAKSFHYGSSDMRPRHHMTNLESALLAGRQLTSTGSQPAALPALPYELPSPAVSLGCGGIVVSADGIDVANSYESGFQIIQQPKQALAAAAASTTPMTITEKPPITTNATMVEEANQVEEAEGKHQHLLERHRSLPRSSRLYHSSDQNSRHEKHHSVNGLTIGYVAGGSSGIMVDPSNASKLETATSRQLRRHRKQQRASIGGQIYEIGAAEALECGQVMDGGGGAGAGGDGAQIEPSEPMSKALANIIKSMDASAPFDASIEQQQQQPPVTGNRNLKSSQWDGDFRRRRQANGEEFEILQHPSFHHGRAVKANEEEDDDDDVDGNLKKYMVNDGGSSSSSSHANNGYAKTLASKYNDPAQQVATAANMNLNSNNNNNNAANNIINNNNKAILCTYNHMTDDQLLQSNIIVFIVNLTLWLPFIVLSIVAQYRDTLTQELKDSVWWLATLNCCSCSYVYAITNKDFREAFNKLFYYCCCKSHVTFQRKTPIFRRQLDLDSEGNLRIHIIPGLNVYSNKLNPKGSGASDLGGSMLGPSGVGNHHWSLASHAAGGSGGSGQTGGTIGGTHSHTSGSANFAYGTGPSSIGFSRSSAAGHGTTSQPRHHHMSVGGGFGGPLFASSKLYSGRRQPDGGGGGGGGSSKAYGRYHSSGYADSGARRKSTVGEL